MKTETRKGFTFIELMITIVILGVLATLAMINLKSFIAQKKLETSAYNLQTLMTKAKVLAYKTETTYFLVFDNASNPTKVNIYRDMDANDVFNSSADSSVESLQLTQDIDGTALTVKIALSSGIVGSGGVITINRKNMVYNLSNAFELITIYSTKIDSSVRNYKILLKQNQPKIHFLLKEGSSVTEL